MNSECFESLSMNGLYDSPGTLIPFVLSMSKDSENLFRTSLQRQPEERER